MEKCFAIVCVCGVLLPIFIGLVFVCYCWLQVINTLKLCTRQMENHRPTATAQTIEVRLATE